MNRYTPDGTIFYKEDSKAFAVQLKFHLGGGGAPYKTIKWATWINEHMPLGFQETNEHPDMPGWKIAELADIVLFADKNTVKCINIIKELVNLGYTGRFSSSQDLLNMIEDTYD